jgi:flagellar basal body-associated protein FliL
MKAPITLKELLPYIFWGILIILALVIILLLIWYFVTKHKKGKVFGPKKITEPAHVIALRELDNLRTEKLWQNGKEKVYYTKLTEIIRVYIEQRFGIYALEMTSDEIVNALNSIILDEKSSVELVKNILFIADLVKFAKGMPLPDENEIGLLNAYQFVNNTKPVVTPNQQIDELPKESNQ